MVDRNNTPKKYLSIAINIIRSFNLQYPLGSSNGGANFITTCKQPVQTSESKQSNFDCHLIVALMFIRLWVPYLVPLTQLE
jgi:hypothetical protein